MAAILRLFSRFCARNVIRMCAKTWRLESSHITVKTRLCYHQRVFQSCVCRLSSCTVGRHFRLEQDVGKHLHFNLFHSSVVLCETTKIVSTPAFPESVNEGDVKWQKLVGDAVAEDEVVLEIETDKTAVPVPSPASGIIEEHLVEDGATVKSGQQLFKLKVTGVAPAKVKVDAIKPSVASPPPSHPAAKDPPSSVPPPTPPAEVPSTSPTPPLRATQPTSPLLSKPVPSIQPELENRAATVKLPPADQTEKMPGNRCEHRVKMSRIRQRTAQRLKEAQNITVMTTTFNEIDMSNIVTFRKLNLETFQKKYKLKFGFMSAFVKASAYALQNQPVVNAVIDGPDIVYRDYIDVSVAVATPKGLVVPVLRNVEDMNFADIEIGISHIAEKARKGTLAIEDMIGGTFTISNGGVFGSLMSTPIINPPQSAILGMHTIVERPVAIKGQVVIRPMMYVSLTYDHRLIDGREAVLFLRKIKAVVEDPRIIFLGI